MPGDGAGPFQSAREAVQFAFGTRFYGASMAKAVLEDGRVNYDDPVHLEYSEDMIKSGIWGADVSGGVRRRPARCDRLLPRARRTRCATCPPAGIDYTKLQSGDIVWFVGDENEPGAVEKRREGTMIHHIGILAREGDGGADPSRAPARSRGSTSRPGW